MSARQRVLADHGINMRVNDKGHTEGCCVVVDSRGMVNHEWVDVDAMTFKAIYEWLGY